MKQNTFLKIFFGLLVFTMFSYSMASYSVRRARIEDPDVIAKVAKHYNVRFESSDNGIFFNNEDADQAFEKAEKSWDIDGQQSELKISAKSSNVVLEKSPDAKLHLFAQGNLFRKNPEDELFELQIQKDEVEVKETHTREATLRVQVPSHIKEIAIKSVSGEFNLKDVSGDKIEISTVSGDVTLQEINFSKVNARSVSGKVNFVGKTNKEISIATTSGDVTIQTDKTTKSEIKLKTVSGSILNPFHSIAGAEKEIEVKTVSGDIELKTVE
jgi:DUF4097 and DUF4098 domain-containing protein YvlB